MLVFVLVGTAITANIDAESQAPDPIAYGFGALFGGLMLVRRRWPLGTLVVTAVALLGYYALSYPPIGLAIPVAAALYSAAEQGRPRWAIGTAAVLLLFSTPWRVIDVDDLTYLIGFELATSVGLMALAIALGDSIRARRGWRAELDRQAHAAALEREREATRRVELERLRLARDLHDLLGHTVSVISLHADVAREALRDDPGRAERSLAVVRAACGEVTSELRATVGALRTDDRDELPVPGLDQLDALVSTARAAGLAVTAETTRPPHLPAIVDATAYRLIQESLSNVLRHAGAEHVTIELDNRDDELRLRVADDGRGATGDHPPDATGGWGIVGMRERLALLGGSLVTESPDAGGFVVEARIPLRGQP